MGSFSGPPLLHSHTHEVPCGGCRTDIKHSQVCLLTGGWDLVVRDFGHRAWLVILLKHAPSVRFCDSRVWSINFTLL